MNILLTGYDGYEGFPLAIKLLKEGHCVIGLDNQMRRTWVNEVGSETAIPIEHFTKRNNQLMKLGNFIQKNQALLDFDSLDKIFKDHHIDVVIHLAAQPSAPFSMKEKGFTIENNVNPTIRLAENLEYFNPKGKFVFVSTMGEYGTPDREIPQGFYQDTPRTKSPASRDPGSWYHLSKVIGTQALYLQHKLSDLNVSVIMQGVVYGTRTLEMQKEHTTRFDFDKYFGTVLNRFVAQCLINEPISIYGKGNQQRGMLSLQNAVNGICNVMENGKGFNVYNQNSFITSISDLAETIQHAGKEILGNKNKILKIKNPRKEADYHLYKVEGELGDPKKRDLEKNLLQMFEELEPYKEVIEENRNSM